MTSYKSLKPSQVKEKPFVNIGAQDLCSIEANWKGFLRKEGQLERGLKKLGPLSKVTSVQWRQYFVVLSQGCVYVFHDEHSASPKVHFPLVNYHKLRRNFSTSHSFEVLPCSSEGKVYKFSCATDTERLEWMRALYVSMLTVHKEPLPDDDQTQHKRKPEEYALLESTVGTPTSAEKCYEIEEDDNASSSDDTYDKPDESAMRTKNKYERDPTIKYKSDTIPNSERLQRSGSEQNEHYDDAVSNEKPQKQRSHSESAVKLNAETFSEDAVSSTSVETKTKQKPQVAPKPKPAKQTMYINSQQTTESSHSRTKSPASHSRTKSVESHSRTKSPASNSQGKSPDSHSRTTSPSSQLNSAVSSESGDRPPSQESDEQSRLPDPRSPTHSKTPPRSPDRSNSKENNYLNMAEDAGYVQPDPGLDPTSEYMFSGNREESARELQLLPDRTFLVRDSAEPGKKVLVVKTKAGLKSYKIEKQNEKFLIEVNVMFDTIHQFIEHYKRHNLPNTTAPLRFGYNAKQSTTPDDDDYEPVGEQPLCFKRNK